MTAQFRPTPTMVSRKLQALKFIRGYIEEWGHSPSLSEIGNALGINRQRARDIVKQLEAEALIVRTAGARGIRLPELEQDALRLLRARGWIVNEDMLHLARTPPITNPALPMLPALEHIPGVGDAGRAREAGIGHEGNEPG